MADQTINIPRDSTMNTLAKDATLSSILAQLTAQQAKLQAITQALIDRDIIGNNSITGIGDGTLTGAVVSLNNGKQKTLVAGDNIAIDQSTGRIDVTGMDVSYNDLDDVPEDIAFYGDETAGAADPIDPPLYASDVVNDLVTGGIDVPLSAEQGKALNQSLAELQTSKLDASNYVKAQNGSFPLLLHSGELWLIAVNRLSAPDAYVCLAHLYNGTVQVSNIYKSTTFSVDTNSQGTLTFKYTGSTTGVQGGAYRLM